ncbi:hypothetical protein E4A48_00685 [Xanthomonas cerealis pv. cerealis]|uniref:Uncharacterized protein n=1 Tax=Xanthomonas cerealis pv. cerealis TaxID=152263 RepID=A0A514E8T0_9XANT|nr:hypothetical protein E4A48_00685 [Xanthomonas translucens pv. cerealis]
MAALLRLVQQHVDEVHTRFASWRESSAEPGRHWRWPCGGTGRPGAEAGGLGRLAVVKAIAQAHGGDATCRPSGTGGTALLLRWPLPASEPVPLPGA